MASTLLWFLFIASVQSLRVVEIGGNLVLKGITNWREIKKFYKANNDESVGAERNEYDGGDIVVYPQNDKEGDAYYTHKHTLIFFKDQGNVPYEYLRQNPKDCKFTFIQAEDDCLHEWFPCFRRPKTLTLSPDDLTKKVKDGQVGFAPHGIKKPQPKWTIAGIWLRPKNILHPTGKDIATATPKLRVVGFDTTKFEQPGGKKQPQGIAVSRLWINEKGHWVQYEYAGGLAFRGVDDKVASHLFEYKYLIKKCDAGQIAIGAEHDHVLQSYTGDYGLGSEETCGAASAYDEYDNEYEQVYDELDRDDAFIRGFYEGYRASERLRKRHKVQSELKYRLNQ